MPVPAKKALEILRERQQKAGEAKRWFESLLEQTRQLREKVASETTAASIELASAYLLALDPRSLERAERLSGFRGFSRRNPIEAMAHERHVLERRITEIANDERYQQRERLLGRIGKLTLAVKEAKDMLEPFATECAKFESLDGFLELVEIGYDTPAFAGKWWTADYWRHWSAGDAICKALGLDDFGDHVLPAYREVEKQRRAWEQIVAEKEASVKEVHDLVREHDRAVARLHDLASIYLEESRAVLGRFLETADFALLEKWALAEGSEDRAILMGLRRLAGHKAKEAVLQDLESAGISALQKDLERRVSKYGRKSSKYSRTKYMGTMVPDRDLDPAFPQRYQRLEAERDKLSQLLQRIESYDDYERFRLENEPELWWFELSGGKPPPRSLPRYRGYFDRHPGARPRLDGRDDEVDTARAVAAASVADRLDGREGEGIFS